MLLCILLALVIPALSSNQVCPGGSFSCPDSATCCQLSDTTYGCCPLKNAVCCDDHIHCCPENNKCEAGICIQLSGLNVTAKKTLPSKPKDIKCSDTQYYCPDNSTCCEGKTPGTYGCCPMKNAVCCSDGYHCCPANTICDLKTEKCVSADAVFEMYDSRKFSASLYGYAAYSSLLKPDKVFNVICPSSTFQCPDGYTCCQLPSGDWGCCPFPKATCCNDHLHCCPENMKCDNTSSTCFKGQISTPSLLKKIAEPLKVGNTCPDNSTCADSMTCCELKSRHFGCCAYEKAVCCEDREHCCPNGSVCDDEQKRCVPKVKWIYNVVSNHLKKFN